MMGVFCESKNFLQLLKKDLSVIYNDVLPAKLEQKYVNLVKSYSNYLKNIKKLELIYDLSGDILDHRLMRVQKLLDFLETSTDEEFKKLEIDVLRKYCSSYNFHMSRDELLDCYDGLDLEILKSNKKYEDLNNEVCDELDKVVVDLSHKIIYVSSIDSDGKQEIDYVDSSVTKFDNVDKILLDSKLSKFVKQYLDVYVKMRVSAFKTIEECAVNAVSNYHKGEMISDEELFRGKVALVALSDIPTDLVMLGVLVDSQNNNKELKELLYNSMMAMIIAKDYFETGVISKGVSEGLLENDVLLGFGARSLLNQLIKVSNEKINKKVDYSRLD